VVQTYKINDARFKKKSRLAQAENQYIEMNTQLLKTESQPE
jgi:hypothetical protein